MDLKPRIETVRSETTTSAHLGERAKRYRFAGALADSPRETEMYLDLATVFDRLAEDFSRILNVNPSAAESLDRL